MFDHVTIRVTDRRRTLARSRGHHPGYYAAYVFDPDGKNIEVVNHHRV
jgi:hypothetical protein